MTFPLQLECADQKIGSALRRWLDRTRLAPPVPLILRVQVGSVSAPAADARAPFRQPAVEIRSGPPQGDLEIRWIPAAAVATLAPGAREVEVVLSPAAALKLRASLQTFFPAVLVFLLRRAGWHHVHGATAVDPCGRGWLVTGNTRAGKSTLSALLASRGWPVGTDDNAFLAVSGERVVVMARYAPIALRRGGRELLSPRAGRFNAARGRFACTVEQLGSTWAPCVDPQVLWFPTVGTNQTTVEPMTPREALTELVRWSAWVILEPELAQGHLEILKRLAGQARSFRATLGRDLFDNPDRLSELIP